MDTVPGLAQIQKRKQELLLVSEMNRRAMRIEVDYLRMRWEGARAKYDWAQRQWKWVAPVVGLLAASRMKSGRGGAAAGVLANVLPTLVRKVWQFWRERRQPEGKDASPASQTEPGSAADAAKS